MAVASHHDFTQKNCFILRNRCNLSYCRRLEEVLFKEVASQPTFTCSKITIETLEQGTKYVHNKVNNKATRTTLVNYEHISNLVLVFLLLTLSRLMRARLNYVRKDTQSEK